MPPIDPNRQVPGPAKTSNELFFDAMVRHQIFLLRFSGSLRNGTIDILNATEEELNAAILKSGISGDETEDFIKLKKLLQDVKDVRGPAWVEIEQKLSTELVNLALSEPAFVIAATKTVTPVILDMDSPSPKAIRDVVRAKPFEGRTLKEWAAKMAADDLARIESQIKIGMIQGESIDDISARVVGTPVLKGADGVTQMTRNQAATITRTAVNHIANQSRRLTFEENKDVFTSELYVATLDARTTPICRSLDGQLFDVGEGPIPPLHFNCRSLRIAVIDNNELVNRPFKASTSRQLLDEFTEANNLKRVRTRADLPFGFKGKYDSFSKKRVRELIGTVPGKTSYQEWLTGQSKSFQIDVLGKTKAKLFRDGGLKLPKFVNRQGDELTLVELATKHKKAFRDAGLDPEDFLD